MFSMCIFDSSISNIHFHTSMMTCMCFVIISWSSLFFIFSMYREVLSRLLLGDGNVESTSSVGGGLGGYEEEGFFCVFPRGWGIGSLIRWGMDVSGERYSQGWCDD